MANSKIGFHVGIGGNHTGIKDWEMRLNGDGVPFGLKSVDHYGRLEEASGVGGDRVANWLVYRMTRASGQMSRETPNYLVRPEDDAVALCKEVVDKLPEIFNKAVWLELLNEGRGKLNEDDRMYEDLHPCEYMGRWCLAAAKYLNAREYKFAGPSFNSGEPGQDGMPLSDAVTQYSRPGMLAYLRYCAEHHTKAALALHEYSWDGWLDDETVNNWYPSLWGRFEAAIAAADLNGIPRTFPIFITEFGFGFKKAPTLDQVRPMLDEWNKKLARFPQVKFAAAWALQTYREAGEEESRAVNNNVNGWMGYYKQGQTFNEGPQPARTHPAFGDTLPGYQTPSEPVDISAGQTLYVNADGLNLREGPSLSHDVILVLTRGTAVTIIEPGGWAKVQANGNDGYVASRYLAASWSGD